MVRRRARGSRHRPSVPTRLPRPCRLNAPPVSIRRQGSQTPMTMHRHARGLLLALASCALAASAANAQQGVISGLPSPRLYPVFPAGAKAGTTVEVVVAGRNLDEPKQLLFSNAAIKGEYVAPPKPEIDPKTKKPKPVPGALPVDNYRFKITVPANTPIGHYDLRVVGKWG